MSVFLAIVVTIAFMGASLALWVVIRDRSMRGRRISNGEIRREDITLSIPNDWMDTFHER
jgi:hypothetical protein